MEEIKDQYQEVVKLVSSILGIKKAQIWMYVPNPMLGDVKPIDMILLGRFDKLKRFILGQIND